MGILDRFRKRPAAAPSPAVQETSQAETPLLVETSVDVPELLQLLAEACPGAVVRKDRLYDKETDLSLRIDFGQMRRAGDLYQVQLLLIAEHPFFDEELVEVVPGFGPSPDAAIRQGIGQMKRYVLPPLRGALQGQTDDAIQADLPGTHVFHASARCPLHAGQGEGIDLWDALRDVIPHYLGRKRCYWLSLRASMQAGVPDCEARVNGMPLPDLTDVLYAARLRKSVQAYSSDRLFILLVQDAEQYAPCPYTKQEAGELTFRALRLLQNIQDPASVTKVLSTIVGMAPEHALGVEIAAFLPEIFAQTVVQYRDSDIVVPQVEGETVGILRKSQLRSYGYIADAVEQFLRKQQPTDEEIMQILAISPHFHAISEAIEKNTSLEPLRESKLLYRVTPPYTIW